MPYQNRLKTLQEHLKTYSCDAFLVKNLINIFYLTGLDLSAGKLLVHPDGAVLIVDGRYIEVAKKKSPFPVVLEEGKTLAKVLAPLEGVEALGFDQETTTYADYQTLYNLVCDINEAPEAKRKLSLVPMGNLVQKMRAVKDEEEIAILREAAILGCEGYDYVCSLLEEGITEAQVALELDIFWKRRGSKGVAFEPIIAFGKGSSMPHYRPGERKLKQGDIVLIDIGVTDRHYHSDMTRVVFFGEPDPKLMEIYAIVKEAQEAAVAMCRAGVTVGDLDATARKIIAGHGYDKYFTHSLGHGIGLEVHELPVIKNKAPYDEMVLEAGMVITIEPGIYLPDLGGVRIEDTVVVQQEGCENLTPRPKVGKNILV